MNNLKNLRVLLSVGILLVGAVWVSLGETAFALDLTVTKLEVTQAIQYLDNPDFPDNSLPLIRGRRTIVRMYIGVAGSKVPVAGVDGELRVFINGAEMAGSPFSPVNDPITAPLVPDREETDDTLNFKFEVPGSGLPDSGTVDVDLVAEVNPDETVAESNFLNNTLSLNDLSFECRRSPSIAYVPINYTFEGEADPENTGLPDPIKMLPGIGDDFLWHTYPIPDPPNYYQAPVPPIDWDEDVDNTINDLLTTLEAKRILMVPMPDFLYGWLPGNPIAGNGWASGNTAFGNTQDDPNRFQRTFAHEIGHLFGLDWAITGGVHYSETLAPDVGFDTGWPIYEVVDEDDCDPPGAPQQGTKCRDLKGFMWAGKLTTEAWISAEMYTFLAEHELLESSCPGRQIFPPLPFRDFFFITGGFVRPGCEVVDCCPKCPGPEFLNPIYQLKVPAKLTPNNTRGTRRLELRDRTGKALFKLNFEVFEMADSEQKAGVTPFALVVPALRNVATVALLSEGKEVAQIKRSPNPPKVTLVSPKKGASLSEQTQIRWAASDADKDPLLFSLQYSPDAGKTFVPLAVNLTKTEFLLDTSKIAGSRGKRGLLRVIATDGLNTTIGAVHSISVPKQKPPTVRIVAPVITPDQSLKHRKGSNLIMVGYGHDPEDGFLPEEALQWVSNINGKLGSGRILQTNRLSVGKHTISLTGTDRDKNRVKVSINVDVVQG